MRRAAFINGKIYVQRNVFVSALLAEDGRITQVGNDRDVLAAAGENAEVVDCGGKTVIPGLNDSHMHLLTTGRAMERADITGCRSVDELVERVRAFAAAHPEATAGGIHSSGWNQDLFTVGEKRLPTRWDLDRISTEYPIALERVCGHVLTANSKVIELLGLHRGSPQFAGGTYETDESGEPNGVFTENGCGPVYCLFPPPDEADCRRMFLRAAKYAVAHGITSVQSNDAGSSVMPRERFFAMTDDIYAKDECPLRYRHQICVSSPEDLEALAKQGFFDPARYRDPGRLAPGPLKLFKDGSLGGRTAAMRQGYLDDPGNYGIEALTQDQLDALCRAADKLGIQVVTHVIGDKAIEDTVAAYERVFRSGKNPLRHGLIHCQITDLPLLERIARDHIPVFYQPIFLDYDMHAVISRCGEALASTSYAFHTLPALGGAVAYGTDSPVEDCNPFPNLCAAVTRKDKNGWPEDGFFPAERVDVFDAVDAYTAGSAFVEFREKDKGRLLPGYLADLVVLDTDIFTCDPMDIGRILPVMTVIGGEVVYSR
ncbi:MAG: amidohydrolase [Clostridia bacterium]|nr:amidohydrolase [Clostridia bacterium]